jgi:hypothetical protein
MDTHIINLASNIIYLLVGIYLFYKKAYAYGFLSIFIWFTSHMHHVDLNNRFWEISDILIASTSFVYVLIKCVHKIKCLHNILLLILLLSIFFISLYFRNQNKIELYDITHSVWHIFSAVFILSLLYDTI